VFKKGRTVLLVAAAFAAVVATSCRRGESRLEPVDIYTQYHGVTFVEKFKIWAAGPDEVVARDAFYEPSNYIYDGQTVFLAALRGETEAFHLVVNADYGNVNDVTVAVSEFRGPGGVTIPAAAATVYFEYYLKVKQPSDYRGRAGAVADPLPPLAKPFDLAKTEAQPLFVVVTVPADARPGKYAATITVSAKKAQSQKLALELTVLPQRLEEASLPPVLLEPDYRAVNAWETGEAETPAREKALAPYLDLLRSRGVAPLDFGYSQARLTTSGAKAAAKWAAAAAGADPAFFYLSPNADGSAPKAETLAAEYKTLYDAFRAKPPKRAAAWPAFEGGAVNPLANGAASAAWWAALRKAADGWPGRPALAAAASPLRRSPGVSLEGAASVWFVPFADVAACPEYFANMRAPNLYFLRADGCGADLLDGRQTGLRLLSWYGYLWGARGLAALAPPAGAVRPANPWRDEPLAGTPAAYGNGFGCWFYPGAPAELEAPVSSHRLELLRQGREDWALLRMVEKKRGRAYVEERLKALLPYDLRDLNDVSARDLGTNQIYELRKALLAELAGGPAPGRAAAAAGRVTDAGGVALYHVRVGDGTFATYTSEDGSYRLTRRVGALEATAPGYRVEAAGGDVKLFRGLRGLEPVFDFESGIVPAQWLAGGATDALSVYEERQIISEGRIALGVEFACGRPGRVVNLYPRTKDFSKFHRLEFDVFNPQPFVADLTLLLLDDDAADVAEQYRHRVTCRPQAWTRVSLRVRDLAEAGEQQFRIKEDGTAYVKAAYKPDLSRVLGVGFEADGLAGAGGRDGKARYKLVIDNIKLVIFE